MKTNNQFWAIRREIGYRIRKQREQKLLTQQAVADELNLSITAYGAIERGNSNFGINRLIEIAKVLNVPVSSFMETKNQQLPISKESFQNMLLIKQSEVKKILDEPKISGDMLGVALLGFYETLGALIKVTNN